VLTSIRETVSNSEHLDLIFDGLPDEYESSISLVTCPFDPFTIDEVETLLLVREVHIDRSRKQALGSINLTQGLGSVNLNSGSSSKMVSKPILDPFKELPTMLFMHQAQKCWTSGGVLEKTQVPHWLEIRPR